MILLNNRLFSINTDRKTMFNYYSINGLKLVYDTINNSRFYKFQIKSNLDTIYNQ